MFFCVCGCVFVNTQIDVSHAKRVLWPNNLLGAVILSGAGNVPAELQRCSIDIFNLICDDSALGRVNEKCLFRCQDNMKSDLFKDM